MIHTEPIWIEGHGFTFVHVELPKTNLLVIYNDFGYIMCGALDVDLLNDKLCDRNIVAGRAVGVRNRDELLYAPLQKVTNYSIEKFGWYEGIMGKQALLALTK